MPVISYAYNNIKFGAEGDISPFFMRDNDSQLFLHELYPLYLKVFELLFHR